MRKARLTAGEIRVRASTVDVRRLEALTKHFETSGSEVIRRLIADAHAAAFPQKEK